jgi:hypothetical protein
MSTAVWQKVVELYQQRSELAPGDPDIFRLGAANRGGWVLHALLAEGWVIRNIGSVTGGAAFVLMEKVVEVPDGVPDSPRAAAAVPADGPAIATATRVSSGPATAAPAETAADAARRALGLRELPGGRRAVE